LPVNALRPRTDLCPLLAWSQRIDAALYLKGKRWSVTAAKKTQLWDCWQRGESLKAIGRAFGKPSSQSRAYCRYRREMDRGWLIRAKPFQYVFWLNHRPPIQLGCFSFLVDEACGQCERPQNKTLVLGRAVHPVVASTSLAVLLSVSSASLIQFSAKSSQKALSVAFVELSARLRHVSACARAEYRSI
jgi:hypothetical protein